MRAHAAAPPATPSMNDLAHHLLLRHHTVVGLVDPAAAAGLVRRAADPHDHRVVRVELTAEGERRLLLLTHAHPEELSRLGPRFAVLWRGLPVTVPAAG
ncbi:MAG: MarR family transcriptional regulator [Acidimicrobiales bacterium]